MIDWLNEYGSYAPPVILAAACATACVLAARKAHTATESRPGCLWLSLAMATGLIALYLALAVLMLISLSKMHLRD